MIHDVTLWEVFDFFRSSVGVPAYEIRAFCGRSGFGIRVELGKNNILISFLSARLTDFLI